MFESSNKIRSGFSITSMSPGSLVLGVSEVKARLRVFNHEPLGGLDWLQLRKLNFIRPQIPAFDVVGDERVSDQESGRSAWRDGGNLGF